MMASPSMISLTTCRGTAVKQDNGEGLRNQIQKPRCAPGRTRSAGTRPTIGSLRHIRVSRMQQDRVVAIWRCSVFRGRPSALAPSPASPAHEQRRRPARQWAGSHSPARSPPAGNTAPSAACGVWLTPTMLSREAVRARSYGEGSAPGLAPSPPTTDGHDERDARRTTSDGVSPKRRRNARTNRDGLVKP